MQTMTSAYANKMLKSLEEDKAFWLNKEEEACTYVAAINEEPVVPDYDYVEVATTIAALDEKIAIIKHELNVTNANAKVLVGDVTMSIDSILIKMAQLNRGKTVLEQFDWEKPSREINESFAWRGGYEPHKLMREISKGGFGLVWCDEEYFERYYSVNQPHKLGFDLAAGIPVIVRKGCVHADFIKNNGLGYVVDSLEEADEVAWNTSDEEYAEMVKHIAQYQPLLLDGTYTKKMLLDAVIQVMEKKV